MSLASSTRAHSLISTRAPLPRNPPQPSALLVSLNNLLSALELPLRLSTIATATPSLLLTILESILQRRFPLIDSTLRASWDRKDRIYIVKFLLGKIGEVSVGRRREGFGFGWEGIDFSEVARGEEGQVGRVVSALIEVARDCGLDCEGVDGGEWEKESLGRSVGTSSGSGSTARRFTTERNGYSTIGGGSETDRTTESLPPSPRASSSKISLRSLNLDSSDQSTPTRRRTAGQRYGSVNSESTSRPDSTVAGPITPPKSVVTHVHIYSDDESIDNNSQRTRSDRPKSKSKRSPRTPLTTDASEAEVGECPCVECGGTVIMSSINGEISNDEDQCQHRYSSPDSSPSTPRTRRKRPVARSTTSTHSSTSNSTTRSRSSKSKLPSSSRHDAPLSSSSSNISPPRPDPSSSRSRDDSKSLNPVTDSSSDVEYHASAAKIPYITRPHFISDDDDASSADGREVDNSGGRWRGSSSESSSGDTVILVERKERLMKQLAELRDGR